MTTRRVVALTIGSLAAIAAAAAGYDAFTQPLPISAIALVACIVFWAIGAPFLLYGIIGRTLWGRWDRRS